MKGCSIMVNKENMDELYSCIIQNLNFLSSVIVTRINNPKYEAFLEEKLEEIKCHMNRVYNPELLELKCQAREFYQKFMSLKDKDTIASHEAYKEYLKLKCKIVQRNLPVDMAY